MSLTIGTGFGRKFWAHLNVSRTRQRPALICESRVWWRHEIFHERARSQHCWRHLLCSCGHCLREPPIPYDDQPLQTPSTPLSTKAMLLSLYPHWPPVTPSVLFHPSPKEGLGGRAPFPIELPFYLHSNKLKCYWKGEELWTWPVHSKWNIYRVRKDFHLINKPSWI